MNMHGVFVPEGSAQLERAGPARRAWDYVKAHRLFFGIVVAPLTLAIVYLFLIMSDQYESEAHFLVRTTEQAATPGIGMSQMLSMATGLSSAQSEAISVADYLTSHDAVATLRREDQLVERFRRPEADITTRLLAENPTPEKLLGYYRKHITVEYSTETGITTLKVRAFRPEDSYALIRKLLVLGEGRVNFLNRRSYTDAIANARRQLAEAEDALAAGQAQLTRYRTTRSDIDPQASGEAQLGLVTTLTGQLAAARAQLNAMGGLIDRNSPQYRAMAARVAGLARQVAGQQSRLAGGSSAIANDISGFEDLKLRQQFLAKRYEAAATALQRSREQAQRQQLYVVRVVDANMPVKSTYPKRFRVLLTITAVLLLGYAIVWLILAGVKEHAA